MADNPLFSLEPLDDDVDLDHNCPPQQSPPPSSANTNAIPNTSELIQRFEASQSLKGGSTATIAYQSSSNDSKFGGRVVTQVPKYDIHPRSRENSSNGNTAAPNTKEDIPSSTVAAVTGIGSPLSLAEAKRRKDAKREEFRRLHPESTVDQQMN